MIKKHIAFLICCLLQMISCRKLHSAVNILPMEYVLTLKCLTIFHLLVPKGISRQIRGIDKQLIVNLWKQLAGHVSFWLCCQLLHICIPQSAIQCEPCAICSVNQQGFNAVHYDWLLYSNFSNLKYSVHSSYTFHVHLKMLMCVQFSLSWTNNDWAQDQYRCYIQFSHKT
jgi:hypothetical protein